VTSPRRPSHVSHSIADSDLVLHYSDLPLNYGPESSGKKLLIVGSGTSAFEVLSSTWEYADRVNLVA
jgi:cation diffusion facilitator CzcD-associated flavoprotein CzcO